MVSVCMTLFFIMLPNISKHTLVKVFHFFCAGAPLFDSSSNFTDPQTMQLLQHSQRLLTNLSTIFHCLISEAQELTQKGVRRPWVLTVLYIKQM